MTTRKPMTKPRNPWISAPSVYPFVATMYVMSAHTGSVSESMPSSSTKIEGSVSPTPRMTAHWPVKPRHSVRSARPVAHTQPRFLRLRDISSVSVLPAS